MPFLHITLPAVSRATREALAAHLTRALCTSTGHAPEVVAIRFSAYSDGEVALAGRLADASTRAPWLRAVLHGPRLPRATKEQLAASLTEALVTATGAADWKLAMHFCEDADDDLLDGLVDATWSDAAHVLYLVRPND